MKNKTSLKAGGTQIQPNQQISRSLKIKSGVKAGKVQFQDISFTG